MTTKVRDSQKSKVYDWEMSWTSDMYYLQSGVVVTKPKCRLTEEQCYMKVDELLRWWARIPDGEPIYGVRMEFNNRGRRSYSRKTLCDTHGYDCLIKIHRNHMNWNIVLHEVAHLITPVDEPPHGPLYMRHYLQLLSGEGVLTEDIIDNYLEAEAKEKFGIKVAPHTDTSHWRVKAFVNARDLKAPAA